jgi:hypothetical protein
LLLDDVESVLECPGEVFAGVNIAGVVAVERAVQNAFDFSFRLRGQSSIDEYELVALIFQLLGDSACA